MIKRLLVFTLRLLIALAAISASAMLFLRWIGYFEEEHFVAYLYEDTSFQLIEFDYMTQMFAEENTPFQSGILYGDASDRVTEMIEKGANTIILNLSETPNDTLIETAAAQDVVLLFVGALPNKTQQESYDKAFCFTLSNAYAGELLAQQIAMDFREVRITDKNADGLLDYTLFDQNTCYLTTTDTTNAILTELEHYGVYATDNGIENLSSAELVIGLGENNVTAMTEQAKQLGLLDAECPIALSCIVENSATAKQLADVGIYQGIVYFDTVSATKTVVEMARNALLQDPVTSGTDYAQTEQSTFVLPHKQYQ